MTATAGTGKRLSVVLALAAALAAVCFAVLASAPAHDASARGTDCGPHTDSTPQEATARQLRKALGCLINAERAERDRRLLRPNADLARVARRHTKVMLAQECFKHQCPGERTLRKRIESSGYLQGGARYGYGQNLGCSETPAAMIAVWMESAFHRKNIVDGRFKHFGIGGKQGSPFPRGSTQCAPGRRHMTYTVIFAWRKRAS